MRKRVLLELEVLRSEKKIGKSLEANVTIFVTEECASAIKQYTGALAELFNVSEVTLVTQTLDQVLELGMNHHINTRADKDAYELGPPLSEPPTDDEQVPSTLSWAVKVTPSDAPKCERCWRFVPDVASDTRYPSVCLRCAEALEAIDFAPYTQS